MSRILEKRLRQVLELLVDAPCKNTVISDDQGDIIGPDEFISPEIKDQAKALLSEWDEEDAEEAHT